MHSAIECKGGEGWSFLVYHPKTNLVERLKQEVKNILSALLVNKTQLLENQADAYFIYNQELIKWPELLDCQWEETCYLLVVCKKGKRSRDGYYLGHHTYC